MKYEFALQLKDFVKWFRKQIVRQIPPSRIYRRYPVVGTQSKLFLLPFDSRINICRLNHINLFVNKQMNHFVIGVSLI